MTLSSTDSTVRFGNDVADRQLQHDELEITGLIVTKLDGSAKGGILVALAQQVGLPVHAVGVGEGAEDLKPFDPREFARSLMDLSDA